MFTNPTYDRELISNIYEDLNKLDTNNPKNSIKKWITPANHRDIVSTMFIVALFVIARR